MGVKDLVAIVALYIINYFGLLYLAIINSGVDECNSMYMDDYVHSN